MSGKTYSVSVVTCDGEACAPEVVRRYQETVAAVRQELAASGWCPTPDGRDLCPRCVAEGEG